MAQYVLTQSKHSNRDIIGPRSDIVLGHTSISWNIIVVIMMQAQYRPLPYARLNSFHGPKRRLLGHSAGQVPPSWKSAAQEQIGTGLKGKMVQEQGSRIFLSRLPVDVGEKDVEVSYYCFNNIDY